MSVPEDVDPITLHSQLNSNHYFQAVSFSILFYDYLITLDWEISRYWGTAWTWPTILYFANRYGTLLGNIPVVIQYFWSTPPTPRKLQVCKGLETYHQYFIIATQILVGAMLIVRTYALYERQKRVLVFMLSVTAGGIALGLWSVITGKGGTDGNLKLYFGCNYPTTRDMGISLAIAWAGVAVFDTMIFLLTLFRVIYRRATSPTRAHRRMRALDLLSVLLRDGAIYFAVMVMSNLSNILTFLLGTPYTRGIATTFTNIISSVMISRLMLNLRDPALAHMSGRRRTQPHTGTSVTVGSPRPRPRSQGLGSDGHKSIDSGGEIVLDTEYELTTTHHAYPYHGHAQEEEEAEMGTPR